jgi:hypothetical protein
MFLIHIKELFAIWIKVIVRYTCQLNLIRLLIVFICIDLNQLSLVIN